MRAAGVRRLGGPVEPLELPGPRGLRAGEVLLDVRACGVGNWDELVRTGGWDTGARPPMALGVEAAGVRHRFHRPRHPPAARYPDQWPVFAVADGYAG